MAGMKTWMILMRWLRTQDAGIVSHLPDAASFLQKSYPDMQYLDLSKICMKTFMRSPQNMDIGASAPISVSS